MEEYFTKVSDFLNCHKGRRNILVYEVGTGESQEQQEQFWDNMEIFSLLPIAFNLKVPALVYNSIASRNVATGVHVAESPKAKGRTIFLAVHEDFTIQLRDMLEAARGVTLSFKNMTLPYHVFIQHGNGPVRINPGTPVSDRHLRALGRLAAQLPFRLNPVAVLVDNVFTPLPSRRADDDVLPPLGFGIQPDVLQALINALPLNN